MIASRENLHNLSNLFEAFGKRLFQGCISSLLIDETTYKTTCSDPSFPWECPFGKWCWNSLGFSHKLICWKRERFWGRCSTWSEDFQVGPWIRVPKSRGLLRWSRRSSDPIRRPRLSIRGWGLLTFDRQTVGEFDKFGCEWKGLLVDGYVGKVGRVDAPFFGQ